MGNPNDAAWSDADRAELQREADSLRDGAPHAAPVRASLLAITGNREAAAALLDCYRASIAAPLSTLAQWHRNRLAHAAFLALRLDLVQELVNDCFRPSGSVRVEVSEGGPSWRDPFIVRWRLLGGGAMTFVFFDSILSASRTRWAVSRWLNAMPLWRDFAERNEDISGEVVLNLADVAAVPGLAFCSERPEHRLIPDNEFVMTTGYLEMRRLVTDGAPPWTCRKPTALWRGSAYGFGRDWQALPRIKLVRLGADPGLSTELDVGLTGSDGRLPEFARAELEQSGCFKPRVEPARFAEWRYQIDIDGYSNSWSGLFRKLCTGSPVLKVASERHFKQWYYDRLIPWSNFVPVASDLSDLVESVRWLQRHDDRAENIGNAGQALAFDMTYEAELVRIEPVIRDAFRSS